MKNVAELIFSNTRESKKNGIEMLEMEGRKKMTLYRGSSMDETRGKLTRRSLTTSIHKLKDRADGGGSHTQLTKVTLSRSLHLTLVGLQPRWPALCNPARRSSRSTELYARLGLCNRVMERGRGRLLCLSSCLLPNVNNDRLLMDSLRSTRERASNASIIANTPRLSRAAVGRIKD